MILIRRFLLSHSDRFLPRWLILFKDIFIVGFAFVLAYTVRYNFQLTNFARDDMYNQLVQISFVAMLAFLFTKLYKGILRHTGVSDAIQVVKAVSMIVGFMLISNTVDNFVDSEMIKHFPYSIIIIFFALASLLLIFTRFGIKLGYFWLKSRGSSINVLIYGAGGAGIMTKNVLHTDNVRNVRVVGFIDNHPGKIGKSIEGIYVYSTAVLNQKFLANKNVNEVIFSIQNIDKERKREIIEELLLKTQIQVKEIPPVDHWINGQLSVKQIGQVRIEDLLQRTEIKLDNKHVMEQVHGRRVMVTGAAGSIGSEIARQLCHFYPSSLILVDQAETPLYDLELELKGKHQKHSSHFKFIIANVGNETLMREVFNEFKPEVIYHAAAYKHVPMMESNPFEAVRVNVFGTKNLADLSSEFKVDKFVMISTDKAVNPTNVMGATKRAAEVYIQSLNHELTNKTRFITTRFGNVLGSNGSVIPLFEKQIKAGGPLTVTHADITRYFMTIPEACQLVLEAGSLGNGGEILMFDMGKPVKIADLAYNMIRLSGLEPGKDIHIVYTGLRPGEKLYEELLYDKEKGQPTYHPKIAIAKVRYNRLSEVNNFLDNIQTCLNCKDRMILVSKLKEMIPEFKSNNSVFQELDRVS